MGRTSILPTQGDPSVTSGTGLAPLDAGLAGSKFVLREQERTKRYWLAILPALAGVGAVLHAGIECAVNESTVPVRSAIRSRHAVTSFL